MYQYTMFILQSLHLLSNRYTTTVTWYLIHVMYQYTMFILQSLHLLSNRYTTTVTWYLIHVEQIVRNGNSIAWMRKRPPLKMIGTMLVSVLFWTFWQLFWTFWQCSINIIYVNLSVKRKFICIHYETGKKAHIAFPRCY